MAVLIIGCLLGVLFGVLLQRLFGSSSNTDQVQAENESLQVELETLRSQVDGHFATSAMMFQNLTGEYRKLLEHMADGARALSVELPEQLLADFSTAPRLQQPTDKVEVPDADLADDNPLPGEQVENGEAEIPSPDAATEQRSA